MSGSAGGGTDRDQRSGGKPEKQDRIIVFNGDAFGNLSPRLRALYAQSLVEEATGGTGGKNS